MHRAAPSSGPRSLTSIERIDFHRTKYGPEVLIDTAWVREMPTFLEHDAHQLTFYDILLVTRGRGSFWLDAHRYPVRPGRVFFTGPGQVRLWKVQDLEGLCVFFPSLFLEEFFSDPLFLHRLPFFPAPHGRADMQLGVAATRQLARRLLAMRRELKRLHRDSIHLLRARLYETLVMLARLYSTAHRLSAKPAPNLLALRYQELIERKATRQHLVEDYARELVVSPGHLNAICKRHLGISAKALLCNRLVVEARRALRHSDESAARIGYALGFKDPSYFTRFFRRATGLSPTQFRRAGP